MRFIEGLNPNRKKQSCIKMDPVWYWPGLAAAKPEF